MTRWELAKLAALCGLIALPWGYAIADVMHTWRSQR